MFNKAFKVQSSTRLKGKDRDNIIAGLKKIFNQDAVKMVFQESEVLAQEKMTGSKMIVYQTDEYPAFVDASGKEDYVPSLYVVSEFPQLIGTLRIKDGEDVEAILKAKTCTWAQVRTENLGEFKKDDIRKLISPDKKLIAIVAVGCDYFDLEKEKAAGIAGYVLHKVGDKLWEHGPGELTDALLPENYDEVIQKKEEVIQEHSDEEIDLGKILKGTQSKKQAKKPAVQKQPQQAKVKFEDNDSDDNQKQKPQKQQQQKQKQAAPLEEGAIPIKVMDEYIKEAFLNAIKIGVTDKNLPIEGQEFYDKFMLGYKKENIDLSLKNSSFQKIGKFLQQMAKEELIEYKELKKGQPMHILKIDRGNEQYEAWEPTVLKVVKKDKEDNNKQQQLNYKANADITELYLPQGVIGPIFIEYYQSKAKEEDWGNIKLEPLTKDQYRTILNWYIKLKCKTEKKLIILTDQILSQLAIKQVESDDDQEQEEGQEQPKKQQEEDEKTKKKNAQNDNLVSLEQIYKKVEELMVKSHKIVNQKTGHSEIKNGEFKGLQIIAEKQHNQPVTRVLGVEAFGFDASLKQEDIYSFAFLQIQLQQKFHCQITIHELPGKNAGREIIIAGNVISELPDFFTNVVKIDPKYIHELNKLALKKKPQTMKQ